MGRKIKTTKQMTRSNIAMLLLVLSTLWACTDRDVTNQHSNIAPAGWAYTEAQSFTIDITQANNYNIDAFIRHNTQYPYSNLWLFVDHIYNNQTISTDTINLTIADKYGHWEGSGWGTTRQIKHMLLHNQSLDTGTHVINIRHAMREENLTGIINVGVNVTKTK